MYQYSPSTKGFYLVGLSANIPADAIEISNEAYQQLREGESEGLVITISDAGQPELISPPPPTEQQLLEQAVQMQQQKLKEAYVQMDPLIYLDSLGQCSAQEAENLRQWREYTVDVSRANQQQGWPYNITWPVKPG
ncbi:tail fiber assembly protein [Aeromonas dhakensis]|uniref:tail fiber assembly protein n=1 Tax=Aeromonas dhakensis TaxID=196024 RepID=UPI003B9F5A9F